MKTTRPAMIVLTLLLLALSALPAGAQTVQARFEESDAFITNPDCGWVAYNYEDSYEVRSKLAGGGEPFAYASVVYTRQPREAWRDAHGGFDDSAPVRLIQDWMDHRRDVAFRVYANRMDDLPPSLRAEVDAVPYGPADKTVDGIAYWDEDYVADHRRLVDYLGQRFGASPYLAFVDVGGVGNTGGEWYLDPQEPFARAGLDDERYYGLVKTFVEMYRQAFPEHAPLHLLRVHRPGRRAPPGRDRPAGEERRGRARRRPGRLALSARERADRRLAHAHVVAEAARLLRGGRRRHLQCPAARPRPGEAPGLGLPALPADLRQPGRLGDHLSARLQGHAGHAGAPTAGAWATAWRC